MDIHLFIHLDVSGSNVPTHVDVSDNVKRGEGRYDTLSLNEYNQWLDVLHDDSVAFRESSDTNVNRGRKLDSRLPTNKSVGDSEVRVWLPCGCEECQQFCNGCISVHPKHMVGDPQWCKRDTAYELGGKCKGSSNTPRKRRRKPLDG